MAHVRAKFWEPSIAAALGLPPPSAAPPGIPWGEQPHAPWRPPPAVVQAAASTSAPIQQRRNRDETPAVILAPIINAPLLFRMSEREGGNMLGNGGVSGW